MSFSVVFSSLIRFGTAASWPYQGWQGHVYMPHSTTSRFKRVCLGEYCPTQGIAVPSRAEPYTKIVEELPQMHRETVHLVRQAVTEDRRTYVSVNNRAEGNAVAGAGLI